MGFTTLLDILGASIFGGILLLNLLRLNENVYQVDNATGHDVNLQVEVVNVADVVESDFNKIGYCADPDKINDDPKVILADTSSIKFIYDVDKNGTYDTVYYYVSGTNALLSSPNPRDRILYRQVNHDVPFILSDNITEFKLQYLDALKDTLTTPLAAPGLANYIKIAFRVEDPFAYDNNYVEAFWRRLTVTSKNLRRN
jgi:type II secretory pathway component PulJ